jgi:hypothetical protein
MYNSLAFDMSGNPHIAYFNKSAQTLMHAWKSGGVWTNETVDLASLSYISLAFDLSGNPHISYTQARTIWDPNLYSPGLGGYRADYDLRHAWKSGGTWTTEPVDTDGSVGYYNSLAFDRSGNPHIAYSDATYKNLKYASATMSAPNTIGYSATVTSGQNTVIQSSNGDFGSIGQSGSVPITGSVVLANTGSTPAKVEARFATSSGSNFGLISGTDVIPAINFKMGPSESAESLVHLDTGGEDVEVGVVPMGGTLSLDAELTVPSTQSPGVYLGYVILTYSNEV